MINYDYIYASAYLKNQNVWFGQNEGSTIDNEDLTWFDPQSMEVYKPFLLGENEKTNRHQ